MLIDLHVHSSAISPCGRLPFDAIVDSAREAGIGAMVLSNHYVSSFAPQEEFPAFARRFADEYERAAEYGERVGVRVLFGIELSIRGLHAHFPIYGVEPEFLWENPYLFDYSLPRLSDAVHAAGGIVVQAHPFRKNNELQDLSYLDGIELNCHPGYDGPLYERIAPLAREHGLFVTCGSDYHGDVRFRPECGLLIPDTVCDSNALVSFLKDSASLRVRLCEPDGTYREEIFERRRITP